MIDDRRGEEVPQGYGMGQGPQNLLVSGKLGRKETVSNPFQADYKTLTATDQN